MASNSQLVYIFAAVQRKNSNFMLDKNGQTDALLRFQCMDRLVDEKETKQQHHLNTLHTHIHTHMKEKKQINVEIERQAKH